MQRKVVGLSEDRLRVLLRKSGITIQFLCRSGFNFYQRSLYVESKICLMRIKKSAVNFDRTFTLHYLSAML